MRLLSLIWLLMGCATPALTEIILEVDSDFPAGALDSVRIEVARGGDIDIREVGLAQQRFPFTIGVVHRGGALGPIAIAVEGSLEGASIVRQLRSATFLAGESRLLRIVISPACVNVVCPAGQGCDRGVCVGQRDDAGTGDAGSSDGGSDAGSSDANLDGSYDTALDMELADAPIGDVDLQDVPVSADAGDECPIEPVIVETFYECPEGCSCSIVCEPDQLCGVRCGLGTRCDIVGAPRSRLQLNCDGAESCDVQFRNGASTIATCTNTDCSFDCTRAVSCSVGCEGSASCMMQCSSTGGATCEYSECASLTMCSAFDLACNRECF